MLTVYHWEHVSLTFRIFAYPYFQKGKLCSFSQTLAPSLSCTIFNSLFTSRLYWQSCMKIRSSCVIAVFLLLNLLVVHMWMSYRDTRSHFCPQPSIFCTASYLWYRFCSIPNVKLSSKISICLILPLFPFDFAVDLICLGFTFHIMLMQSVVMRLISSVCKLISFLLSSLDFETPSYFLSDQKMYGFS